MFLMVNKAEINSRKEKIRSYLQKYGSEAFLSSGAYVLLVVQLVLQNKLLATYLTKSVFGEWSILLSIFVLISMLPFSAFDQAIARMAYAKLRSSDKYYFVNSTYVVYLLMYIVYALLTKLAVETLFVGSILDIFYYPFIAYAFSEILKNSLLIMDNASRNRVRAFFTRLWEAAYRTLALGAMIYFEILSIENILFAFSVGNMLSIITSYKKFGAIVPFIKYEKTVDVYKEIILFSYPLMIWALFGWSQNMINRWYLNIFLDTEAVAKFTILISISFFLPNALYGIVNNFFIPIVFSRGTKSTVSFYKKYLGLMGAILLCYVIIISFTCKYLVLFLADSKYIEIAPKIPLISITSSLYVLAMLSTFEVYRSGDVKILLLPTVLSGAIPMVLGLIIVRHFGFNGAILNYVIGQLTYTVMVFTISYKHVRNGEENEEPFAKEQMDMDAK